jgi:hypothetical protein
MVAGMRPTNAAGEPLLTLTIRRIPDSSVPPVPAGAMFSYAGYAYEVEPSGASFDPYATLSITVSEQDWAGLQGRELFIKWYNPSTSAWEDIPTIVLHNLGDTAFQLFPVDPALSPDRGVDASHLSLHLPFIDDRRWFLVRNVTYILGRIGKEQAFPFIQRLSTMRTFG